MMEEAGDSNIKDVVALSFGQAAAPVGSAGRDQEIEQTRKLELRKREAELTAGPALSKTASSSAMANVVRESLASGTAHGISRAAATNSIPLRVAWILLFLFFLGLFCKDAITHVYKLINVNAVTTVQMDKVPFEKPDIYVCPNNVISGSYPYSLNESEAAMVNAEVERLGKRFDELAVMPKWGHIGGIGHLKTDSIFNSLSPKVLKLLLWRPEQSVQTFDQVPMIYPSVGMICAKLKLHMSKMYFGGYRVDGSPDLFTDPYNPHLNYTGFLVNPIVELNKTVELLRWNFDDEAGITLYFVPRGTMPDKFSSGLSMLLAPGQSYNIELSMEKVEFSKEFHGKNCSPREPNLVFLDRLSGGKLEYNFSFIACYFEQWNRLLFAAKGRVDSDYSIPWDLRNSSQYGTVDNPVPYVSFKDDRIFDDCKQRQPCAYPRYTASYSAAKWPDFRDGKYSWLFREPYHPSFRPAMDQLARIAKQLDASNRSSEDHRLQELEFRQLLANSFLRFGVWVPSDLHPLLTIVPSYSWTAFMSDIGGLLGVYIGCSLLTVCELLELLYLLMSHAVTRRTSGRPEGHGAGELPDATPDGAEMGEQLTEGV